MSLPPQLMHSLEGLKYQLKDAFWALSSCICQQSAKVKINGRTCQFWLLTDKVFELNSRWSTLFLVKIVKVLGEGGFSFVYLAQDEHSGVCRLFLFSTWCLTNGARFQLCRDSLRWRRSDVRVVVRMLDRLCARLKRTDGSSECQYSRPHDSC